MAGRIDEEIIARKLSLMFPGKEVRARRIFLDCCKEEGEEGSGGERLAT